MRISALTSLIFQVNSLIDTGQYTDISIKDVHQAIEKKQVLRFLDAQCGADIDLSLLLGAGDNDGFEDSYEAGLDEIYGGYAGQERRKFGVEKSGLCLVVAWTVELIQRSDFTRPS